MLKKMNKKSCQEENPWETFRIFSRLWPIGKKHQVIIVATMLPTKMKMLDQKWNVAKVSASNVTRAIQPIIKLNQRRKLQLLIPLLLQCIPMNNHINSTTTTRIHMGIFIKLAYLFPPSIQLQEGKLSWNEVIFNLSSSLSTQEFDRNSKQTFCRNVNKRCRKWPCFKMCPKRGFI